MITAQWIKYSLGRFLLKLKGTMKVYLNSKKTQTLFIQPGIHYPEVSEWLNESGKPTMFTVKFEHGCAEIEDKLGKYLVEKGLAKDTMLYLPEKPHTQSQRIILNA